MNRSAIRALVDEAVSLHYGARNLALEGRRRVATGQASRARRFGEPSSSALLGPTRPGLCYHHHGTSTVVPTSASAVKRRRREASH